MKLATWNVNSLKVRLPHVLELLAEHQPDALCLQETKTEDDKFPIEEITAAGYRVVFSGQKTYNGVAILSRAEAQNCVVGITSYEDPQKRVIAAMIGGGSGGLCLCSERRGRRFGKVQVQARLVGETQRLAQRRAGEQRKIGAAGRLQYRPRRSRRARSKVLER